LGVVAVAVVVVVSEQFDGVDGGGLLSTEEGSRR